MKRIDESGCDLLEIILPLEFHRISFSACRAKYVQARTGGHPLHTNYLFACHFDMNKDAGVAIDSNLSLGNNSYSLISNSEERCRLHALQRLLYLLWIVDSNLVVDVRYPIRDQAFVLQRMDLELSVAGLALDRLVGKSNSKLASRKGILFPRFGKVVLCWRWRFVLSVNGNKMSRREQHHHHH